MRLRLGLTQKELAERLGMARNTVTRYERGFLPRIPRYVQLAILGLTVEGRHEKRRGR